MVPNILFFSSAILTPQGLELDFVFAALTRSSGIPKFEQNRVNRTTQNFDLFEREKKKKKTKLLTMFTISQISLALFSACEMTDVV